MDPAVILEGEMGLGASDPCPLLKRLGQKSPTMLIVKDRSTSTVGVPFDEKTGKCPDIEDNERKITLQLHQSTDSMLEVLQISEMGGEVLRSPQLILLLLLFCFVLTT